MATSPTTNIRRAIIPLLSLLILTTGIIPLAAAAPITITTSKDTYNPGDTLVVSGTATPNSAVTIKVYNPATNLIAIGQGNTDTAGQYSVSVFTWPLTPTLDIPFGIYSITATDAANGDVAETTVEFAQLVAPPPEVPEVVEALLQVTISTGATYQLGDTARIYALFTYSGNRVDPTVSVFVIYTPELTKIPRSLVKVEKGLWYVDYTPTVAGIYGVRVEATAEGTTNNNIASFTVTERLATETGVTALSNDIADISAKLSNVQQAIINRIASAQTSLSGAISSAKSDLDSRIGSAQSDIKSSISDAQSALEGLISSAQNSLSGAISSAKSDLDSRIGSAQSDIKSSITSSGNSIKSQITSSEQAVKSAIDGIQSAVASAVTSAVQPLRSAISQVDEAVDAMEENLDSTNAGVSAASTWIIVVGIIAAITLVLELVTLVRRLS